MKDVFSYRIERFLTLLFSLMAIALLCLPFFKNVGYTVFGISDWLINYQGGFVRRGLIGDLLWHVYQWHPYDVKFVILTFQTIIFLGFSYVMYRLCSSQRWSFLPILFPVVCLAMSFEFYRRDFLMILLGYGVYSCFFRYLSFQRKKWLLIAIFILSLSLIIYEPMFFLMMPFMVFLYFSKVSGKVTTRLLKTAAVFALPCITMGLMCLFKGSGEVADAITSSWNSMFETYSQKKISSSVDLPAIHFMKMSTTEAFLFHINLNFFLRTGVVQVFCLLAWCLQFVGVYLLTSRVFVVNKSLQRLEKNPLSRQLGWVMLFHLITMLPMFTILSCDYGRTIPYCIYMTFIIVHLHDYYKVEIPFIPLVSRLSDRFQSLLSKYPFVSTPWFYFILILFIPLSPYYCPHPLNNIWFRWGSLVVEKVINTL